ncbi:SH3 domain-containing protein [Cercophora newfieldiana]|uniref:SH3 domain-containing protein n=1 Tax=Cercophora newfieldiana TaxID=92897 RepID=A0AA39YR76_9PEZI|nr:SH3 domain-containing protein [Cercophora newfieldiana]
MVSADRQQVIETNRSLRTIKTELEALLEKGVLAEDAFDSIQRLLPAEGTLSGTHSQRGASALPTPATTPSTTPHHAPPSYSQSTGNSAAPPLPGRKQPPPAKPVVAHCKALYAYTAQDARDCSFEKGDRLAVYEKMNADWWLGVNERTREEGIFPKAYVEEEAATPAWNNEKAGYQAPQTQYGNAGGAYPPPPGQANPYNAHAPPMAMANGEGGVDKPSKTEENSKKFGKKLGNAAIFGAGATLGGKIVNSIF